MNTNDNPTSVKVSFLLPIYTYNELSKILSEKGSERFSDLARRAIRRELKLIRAREAKEFVQNLSPEDKKCLLEELKKGS